MPLLDKCFELHEDFQTCTDIEKVNCILNDLNVNFVAKSIFQTFVNIGNVVSLKSVSDVVQSMYVLLK